MQSSSYVVRPNAAYTSARFASITECIAGVYGSNDITRFLRRYIPSCRSKAHLSKSYRNLI